MNIRTATTLFALLASTMTGAQAQTSGNGGNSSGSAFVYTLRLVSTSAGARTAIMGSLGAPYRYTVTLLPQGCGSAAGNAPLLSMASLRDVSTTAGIRRAELRIPLASPSGCAMVGSFDLAAEDGPVQNPPDERGPGLDQMMMPLVTPPTDLTAAEPVQLGSGIYAWGGSVILSTADASSRGGGVCKFRYLYTTLNIGAGISEYSGTTLTLGNADGLILAVDPLAALAPGGSQIASGKIGLPPGRSVIVVSVDAPQLVDETVETNNLRQIEVDVRGNCG